jgi:CPA2 family monovalent cation:H+ antiporter-2
MRAKLIVISYTDTISTLKVLRQVQAIRPELPVVVRTLDDSDIDLLKEAGAAEVVAEIMEGSIMLASHALMHLGVPLTRVLSRMRETREQRYSLFRGFYHGASDEVKDSGEKMQLRLLSVMISPGSAAVGKKLGKLDLESILVEVPAVRRRNVRELLPDKETKLEAGDVLVLRGTQENLAAAEIRLLQG